MADFRTFDPCNLLAPVPAVMVSCRAPEADAKPNIVTVAWVGTVNSEPPMMSISVRGNRFSHDLIAKSGEFVVNLVDEAHCKALDFCGVRSGRDVDKWQECDLTPMPALNMDYAPAIAECPAYLACKVVQQLELGSHTMFVGKIIGVQVRDDVVEQQQKENADPKAEKRRQKREFSHRRRLLDGGDQQAPHRGRDHHARGKARQRALHSVAERLFHEEHARRAERRAEKWDQNAVKCFHVVHLFPRSVSVRAIIFD